jgi:methionyl-tRNA formyltransferase
VSAAGAERWRVVVVAGVPPVAAPLVAAVRELGHDPVAVLGARAKQPVDGMMEIIRPGNYFSWIAPDVALLFPAKRAELAGLLAAYAPDLLVCFGYRWKIPVDALAVPRLGCVNCHPALLPRHRGPYPMAWGLRDGRGELGITWHRMDADFDTGPILAQAAVRIEDDETQIEAIGPKMNAAAFELLPRVFERVAAGDPGDPQVGDPGPWAAAFGEDYATVDWSQPARAIHDQVRAWQLTFGAGDVQGPVAELDGRRVRLLDTRLSDPGGGAARVETGDGPLWVVATEPVA